MNCIDWISVIMVNVGKYASPMDPMGIGSEVFMLPVNVPRQQNRNVVKNRWIKEPNTFFFERNRFLEY